MASLAAMSYAGAAVAAPVTGTAKVQLRYVSATLQNGQQDQKPEDVAACRKQVSSIDSRYLGVTVTTRYSVDVKTLIMSASSSLPSPVATKPLILTISLSPLGIAGQYAFGAFRPAALPNTYVLYLMGLDFKAPRSSVLVLNQGKAFNCLVSSDPSPLTGALADKLKVDQ
ncbi:hypothetical protein [Dyella acidiphila]|uniref:Uncharacterized protein n=1 Tax=Dyella acidiphila TaxID=2775866 RepID=A0ABR9GDB3_9GAMM|nr:hypothetical protein [Dyella acidiphila]MBE1162032.1 hypothetical protein [Dyella acidiphila]